jgi:predicted transcriptional regulator YdeE/DNA-binding transcriptional MerR regulator
MLKIGDFSKLGHVTVKALRHYARIGLLRPEWTDRFSGYRYYSLGQLPRLNRILALKELGFSLAQVAHMVGEQVSAEQLRKMLSSKQAELQSRLLSEQMRLAQVEARLRQIEQEGKPSGYEVVIKYVASQKVASIRSNTAQMVDLPQQCAHMCVELSGWLANQRLKTEGPWFMLNNNREYTESHIALELAVEVDGKVPGRQPAIDGARISVHTLPEVKTMASVIHTAGTDNLVEAYTTIYDWIDRSGCRISGPAREIYLDEEVDDIRACQVIEVQVPVEKFTLSMPDSSVHTTQEESKMEPKVITKPAFMVVGMQYVGKNENQEISQMWGRFNPRVPEIKNIIEGNAYGVCDMIEVAEAGAFEYVAGFEVSRIEDLPEGMIAFIVPEQKYAVFEHRGSLESLRSTYEYIHQAGLSQSGFHHAKGPELEVYDDKFKDFSPDSIFYIYIPIE